MKWIALFLYPARKRNPTTLKELLERYLVEVTPLKKGAAPETNCLRAFMKNPLAQRFVAGMLICPQY